MKELFAWALVCCFGLVVFGWYVSSNSLASFIAAMVAVGALSTTLFCMIASLRRFL